METAEQAARRLRGPLFGQRCVTAGFRSEGGLSSVLELCEAARPPSAAAAAATLLAGVDGAEWAAVAKVIADTPASVRAASRERMHARASGGQAVLGVPLHMALATGASEPICHALLAAYPRAAGKRAALPRGALGAHLGRLLPLHIALLRRAGLKLVRALLSSSPAAAAKAVAPAGVPPLHVAVRAGCDAAVIELLLAAHPEAVGQRAELRWSRHRDVPLLTVGEFVLAGATPLHVAALGEVADRKAADAVAAVEVLLAGDRAAASGGRPAGLQRWAQLLVAGATGWAAAAVGENLTPLDLGLLADLAHPAVLVRMCASPPHDKLAALLARCPALLVAQAAFPL